MFHEVTRTNAPGEPFVGRCKLCGKGGIDLDAMQTETCPVSVVVTITEPPPGPNPHHIRVMSPEFRRAAARGASRNKGQAWKGARW